MRLPWEIILLTVLPDILFYLFISTITLHEFSATISFMQVVSSLLHSPFQAQESPSLLKSASNNPYFQGFHVKTE
jgi:hypothetical protein